MRDTRMTWLVVGLGLLVVSFIAAFAQASGANGDINRNVFVLEGWLDRTSFWLGLVFVAGYILDTVYGARRGR